MALNKKQLKLGIAAIAVAVVAFFGYKYWEGKKNAVPEGIAWGNGRLEAKLVDITSKDALRVKEVLVDEGAVVKPGDVLARMDTLTLDAELAQAKANVAAAREHAAIAKSGIARQKSQVDLAKIEAERSGKLLKENAGSQREHDVRTTAVQTTRAGLGEEQAKLSTAEEQVKVAEANVTTIQTRIDDATLTAPVLGRVLYRLAEPGEVLAAGGKVLTLVNLNDVYMEIYLPAEQAGRTKMGADARITVDYIPGRAAPGTVTFVSPEAQFTPKQVETRSEREKLMFRVKIQLPKAAVEKFAEHIKTGVRGVGYVQIDKSTAWPDWLQNLIVQPDSTPPPPAATPATGQ